MKASSHDLVTAPLAAMLALLLVAPGVAAPAADHILQPAMTGNWSGTARIIVVWCQQTNLPVSLTINADGSVGGKVGDAMLKDARLRNNRGWLGRKLNIKTDYIIVGKLTGPIVASEHISRSRVSMPLNFSGGKFAGGLHTSGAKWGGKDRMILSASHLVLVRGNAP